jgi:hypothetical protein
VLKSVARKRLLKSKDFYMSCDYNDNWSVWLSGTVVIGYGGDTWVVDGSHIQYEALSRYTLTATNPKLVTDTNMRHVNW